jgi:2-polyprenyl-6-hydroxyphenyl methylase/3-demethylubiquinone-9 3-methyltransferase
VIEAPSDSHDRFGFGANWRKFIELVDDDRVEVATASVRDSLQVERLDGRRFLDIGCGSGLFSLAAHRLGADVVSFDYDADSVGAAREIQRRFAEADAWPISQGSVLDEEFLESLGTFDFVYSFGVLHHTGAMWTAIDNAARRVAPGGSLYITLYNDQDRVSKLWLVVKKVYNRLPRFVRPLYVAMVGLPREAGSFALALAARDPKRYVHGWTQYRSARGMSRWRDLVDWVGGLPFEVAAPGTVVNRMVEQGFTLKHLVTCGRRLGCNEFLFDLDV